MHTHSVILVSGSECCDFALWPKAVCGIMYAVRMYSYYSNSSVFETSIIRDNPSSIVWATATIRRPQGDLFEHEHLLLPKELSCMHRTELDS